jgi:hypothetical protein
MERSKKEVMAVYGSVTNKDEKRLSSQRSKGQFLKNPNDNYQSKPAPYKPPHITAETSSDGQKAWLSKVAKMCSNIVGDEI